MSTTKTLTCNVVVSADSGKELSKNANVVRRRRIMNTRLRDRKRKFVGNLSLFEEPKPITEEVCQNTNAFETLRDHFQIMHKVKQTSWERPKSTPRSRSKKSKVCYIFIYTKEHNCENFIKFTLSKNTRRDGYPQDSRTAFSPT